MTKERTSFRAWRAGQFSLENWRLLLEVYLKGVMKDDFRFFDFLILTVYFFVFSLKKPGYGAGSGFSIFMEWIRIQMCFFDLLRKNIKIFASLVFFLAKCSYCSKIKCLICLIFNVTLLSWFSLVTNFSRKVLFKILVKSIHILGNYVLHERVQRNRPRCSQGRENIQNMLYLIT